MCLLTRSSPSPSPVLQETQSLAYLSRISFICISLRIAWRPACTVTNFMRLRAEMCREPIGRSNRGRGSRRRRNSPLNSDQRSRESFARFLPRSLSLSLSLSFPVSFLFSVAATRIAQRLDFRRALLFALPPARQNVFFMMKFYKRVLQSACHHKFCARGSWAVTRHWAQEGRENKQRRAVEGDRAGERKRNGEEREDRDGREARGREKEITRNQVKGRESRRGMEWRKKGRRGRGGGKWEGEQTREGNCLSCYRQYVSVNMCPATEHTDCIRGYTGSNSSHPPLPLPLLLRARRRR